MALEPTPNGTALPGGDPISQWAAPETHAVQREREREKLSGELLAWIGRGPGPIHADLTWNGHHQSSMLVNNKPSAISHPPSIMSSQRRCAFFCLWRRAFFFVPLPWKRSRVDDPLVASLAVASSVRRGQSLTITTSNSSSSSNSISFTSLDPSLASPGIAPYPSKSPGLIPARSESGARGSVGPRARVNPPLGSSPFRQERQEALVALCCSRGGFRHRSRHSLQYGGCASRTPDRHLSIRTAAPRALSRLSIATYTAQRGCLSGEATTSRRIGRGTRNCRALVVVSRRWKTGGPLIMDALSACGSIQIVPQTRRPALEGWNEVLSKLGPLELNE